jgi:propionyl-CoA carboxylase alpha chain
MFLDDVTRKAMGEQAVKLCKKICYFSAGTVEFLVDKNRNFYFLEMNTRLQVEHPVTECITGVDLIHEMIRIARGHSLNMRQNDVKINGCAIESRIYAEDPYKNFGLPSIGRLYKYIEPNGLGIRCDSGVEEGSEISFHYDSMISKLICFGKDRQEAIDKSTKALDCYIIRGVTHNIPLLRDILTQERFIKGDINTNYLSEVYPDGFKGHQLALEEKKNLLLVASALYINNQLRNKSFLNESKLQNHGNVWRNWDIVITLNRKNYSLRISQLDELLEIKIDDEKMITMSKKDINLANPLIKIEINKEKVIMQLVSKSSSNHYTISYRGASYNLDIISKEAANFLHLMRRKSKTDVSRIIKSPMPGLVKSVSCKKGDIISEGQELCTIEAMKMQNAILALTTGKVKTVRIKEGVAVSDDEVLIELD